MARVRRWREEVGARWESLTAREREVLRLVAVGRNNRQIAEVLCISENTVETHVGNLLGKLEATSRAGAIAWVWRHSLAEGMDLGDADS